MKKVVKNKRKINKLRILTLIFFLTFVISFFKSANVLAQVFPFNIDNVSIKEKSSTVTGNISKLSKDEIKNNIIFHQVGDSVTFDLKLKNNFKKDITIISITDDNDSDYVTYEYDKHENDVIKPGESFDLVIKATYENELTDITKREQANELKLSIKYLSEGEVKDAEIVVNPTTGDHINISFIILFISATGLITCIVISSKRKNKKISVSSILVITGLVLTPTIAKAATYVFNIGFVSQYKLYDKQIVKYTVDGVEKTKVVPYGEYVVELDAPQKDGYTFDKWIYEDGTDFDTTQPIKEDIKIKAKYNTIKYNINYDLNGGTTTTNNKTEYTIEDKITLVEPTKEHYTFAGWTGTDLNEPTKNVVIENKIGNRSYTATYTPTSYSITYNGLTDTEKQQLNNYTEYTIETDSFTLNNPNNRYDSDGDLEYTFAGWKENNTISSTVTLPNINSMGNKVYEAQWTKVNPNTYTITYNLNGGTTESANVIEFTKETETFTLVNPTKEGYTFKGWSGTDLDGDSNTEVKVYKGTRKNLEFTANYTANTYKVKFDKNGNNVNGTMNDQTFTYDVSNKLTNNSYTKEGYTFIGWNTESNGSGTSYSNQDDILNLLTEGEITLYAQWTPNTYEIEFISNGDNTTGTMSNLSMTYDVSKTLTLNNYSKEGYTFSEWNTNAAGTGESYTNGQSVSNLASNGTVKLYAQWTPNTYEIEFIRNNDNTTGNMSNLSMTYDVSKNLTANAYTLEGYTFAGWTTKADGTGESYTNGQSVSNLVTNGTVKLYAQWIPNTYTIVFRANNDNAVGNMLSLIMNYGESRNLLSIAYTLEGYTFSEWNTKADGTGDSYTNEQSVSNLATSGTVELYAQWTPNTYEIEFMSNNDNTTGTMSNLSMTYDVSKNLTTNAYALEGYTFSEWNTKADGTGDSYTNGQSVSNLASNGIVRLYAQWVQDKITVTFDSNGGTEVNPIEINPGSSIGTLPTTTKDDSAFLGWYINLSDSNPIDSTYTPTENITLHAKWSDILCIKATTLTSETCQNSSNGCKLTGYSVGDKIEYGSISTTDTLNAGDALLCDVDGTGYNQRFYYLRTNDDRLVLISNNNFEGASGQSNANNFVYDQAESKLPTTTQWNKLTYTFENDKAARLLTLEDLKVAANRDDITTNVALGNIDFIFENTTYANSSGRSTLWVKEEDGKRYRVHKNTVNVVELKDSEANTSKNSVRPVIEVPINLIDNSYMVRFNPNGGTVTNEYMTVSRGTNLSTLPTPTKENGTFNGWYTSLDFIEEVNENTIPTGNVTYYAKWKLNAALAEVEHDNFALEVGNTDRVMITNIELLEDYMFISNSENIVSIDSDGVMTALNPGTTTILIKGLESNTYKTINVRVVEQINEYIVTFDSNGGSTVDDMHVPKNTAIGTLPVPTKTNYDFYGWYTNTDYTTEVKSDTVITKDMTLVARWIPANSEAESNGTYYTNIQTAIDSATNNKTTIKLLKDITRTSIIDMYNKNTGKDIVLDLNGHSITNDTTNVIRTKGKLEIKNGTLYCASGSGAVDVGSGGKLVMNSGSIIASGTRQAIYNDGGTVEIGGDTHLSAIPDVTSSNFRATIQNINGSLKITGGNIESDKYAVTVTGGTLTIGEKDGVYDTESLSIKGDIYGIYSTVSYSIYDGTFKGKTNAVNDESRIVDTEENATKVNATDNDYKVLYYTLSSNNNRISFNANGGEVNPTYTTITKGDAIGELPVPTRGVYVFDGWFTSLDFIEQVDENTIPTGNVTYYAKWHYEANNNIVSFNMTNDVMRVYYDNIDTWKVDESTFQSNMDTNFNNYNCKCNENTCSTAGTELCDKPKGYNTGFEGDINVYESDENTKVKGDAVTYTTVSNGIIYNMIPGQVYYWELVSDDTVHGLVKAEGERRILAIDGVRNVRDLGGLKVDTNKDGIADGTLKYGKIFRGERLYSDSSNATKLAKLGINEEIDLRASSEIPSTEIHLDNFKHREIKHYQIDYTTQLSNYNLARNMAIEAMQDVIDGKNIYFHCRIGTDRTGTLAYILEGLLDVQQEDMLEDYELSYFFGLVNRHRFYSYDPKSTVSKDQKFGYMYNIMPDANGVYDWFMLGSTDPDADNALINSFKAAMIES